MLFLNSIIRLGNFNVNVDMTFRMASLLSFRCVLLKIDGELHGEDLESLKFLCLPHIKRKQAAALTSGHRLFEALEKSCQISESDPSFLHYLLNVIGRRDLSSLLEENVTVQLDNASNNANSHRTYNDNLFFETLYQISEEMGPDDVERLRYLYGCVPKSRPTTSGIQLFSVLIERDVIGPARLESLMTNLEEIGRLDLVHMLRDLCDKGNFGKSNPGMPPGNTEPAYVISHKSPVMVSDETYVKTYDEECVKKTKYYVEDLMEKMDTLNVSSEEARVCSQSDEKLMSSLSTSALPSTISVSLLSSTKEEEPENKSENLTVHLNPYQSNGTETPSENAKPSPLPRYKMDACPRGICLVIDIEDFTYDPTDKDAKEMKNRRGSDKDQENIKACFSKLEFDVRIQRNLTCDEILQCFKECASDTEGNSRRDCFVSFILSHGGMHQGSVYIYGTKGHKLFLNEVIRMFRPDQCPSLWGKPKVFFLACCLGTTYSKVVRKPLHMSETDSSLQVQTDCSDSDEEEPRSFVCNDEDFLIGYSTVKGNVSFRDTRQGTWYIAELTRVLREYHERESLQHMLVLVNQSVSKNKHECKNERGVPGQYGQVPSPQHTLTKQLWF